MYDIFEKLKSLNTAPTVTGTPEFLVVGLGNPEPKYDTTRHNAGFMAIDHIAQKTGCKVNQLKFKSLCGMCEIEGKKVMLIKPTTYMNSSGEAVREAAAFYKIPPEKPSSSSTTSRWMWAKCASAAKEATEDTTASRASSI